MSKSKVYFTPEITPESLVKIYHALGKDLEGKIGIKISTGEAGNNHYLKPELIKQLVDEVKGTIVECNVAYSGGRDQTERHLETARDHGFTEIAEVDIMDRDGEIEIPVNSGHIPVDIVGKNIDNYDGFINLAHFKGHEMGGFGGVIKNQSIGFASANGKAYIHTAGKTHSPVEFMTAFEDESAATRLLPEQDVFLETMAETAKAVADHTALRQSDGTAPIVYINVINNLSIDCDCSATPEAPCMADIGIAASLDPVALDQACLDLIKNSADEGKEALLERVNDRNGEHTLEHAAKIGFGSRDYELVSLD